MPDVDDFIGGDDTEAGYSFDPEVVAEAEARARAKKTADTAGVEAHLRRCKQAYTAVFVSGTATAADLEFVLKDLFWFAKGDEHFFKDARVQDLMAGRKQVLQRISEYTRFDFETLRLMYVEAQR